MQRLFGMSALSVMLTLAAGAMILSGDRAVGQTNPCASKSVNPGAAKAANPCAPKPAANPCAGKPEVDSKLILRPKATNLAEGNRAQLIKQGQALFNDTKLSTNGMSCMNCHADNANFAASFTTPYPHRMAMAAEKSGVEQVRLDEAIQFCMIVPMQAKPLSWSSRELSALTAYMGELQTAFRKETAGATGSKNANPCAPKAANPCAPKK